MESGELLVLVARLLEPVVEGGEDVGSAAEGFDLFFANAVGILVHGALFGCGGGVSQRSSEISPGLFRMMIGESRGDLSADAYGWRCGLPWWSFACLGLRMGNSCDARTSRLALVAASSSIDRTL